MDITQRRMTKIAREAAKFTTRTLRADGVGTAEFDLIHVVRHAPGITQAEACKRLGVDKGAVARQAANLESKGYLIRARNPKDGRSQLLYATEKAERLKACRKSWVRSCAGASGKEGAQGVRPGPGAPVSAVQGGEPGGLSQCSGADKGRGSK